MTCIEGLLGKLCKEIEAGLTAQRENPFEWALVVMNLPQKWVFEAGSESVVLSISKKGKAKVKKSKAKKRDVTIKWDHDSMANLLRTRSPSGGTPTVKLLTPAGATAFRILRERIGLVGERESDQ
jgi:hypothetical protein